MGNYYGVYYSVWIKNSSKKIRLTSLPPKVRVDLNPTNVPLYKEYDFHRIAEIGDMDYYGWIIIDMWKQYTLLNPTTNIIDELEELPNDKLYRRLLKNHKQKMYRKRK